MNTKHLLLSFLLLWLAGLPAIAERLDITAGNGTSTSYNTPYCNYYRHGATQMIYSAASLKGAGKIYAIAFQVASAAEYATTGINIYLGHKQTAQFADATDYVPFSDLTLVYSGTPTLGQEAGWEEMELTTPFDYEGTNLVVAVEKHASSYTSKLTYNYSSASKTVLCRQNDSDANYGDLTKQIDYNVYSSRPNIRLTMELPLTTQNGITYVCSGGIASIFGTTADLPAQVTIPASVSYQGKSYAVTNIPQDVFTDNTAITSISLPNTITSIGEYAFSGCTQLTSIKLSAQLTDLPKCALMGCAALRQLSIPGSVSQIASDAFSGCTGVTQLTLEDGDTPLVLNSSSTTSPLQPFALEKLYLGRDLDYTPNTYSYNSYGSPFAQKATLTSLTIGPKVTELKPLLFYNTAITELTLPATLASVGDRTFYNCTKLKSITIADGTSPLYIDNRYSFYSCSSLEKLYLGRNITYDDQDGINTPFYSPQLSELTIGPKVNEISPYLFYNQRKLTRLTLPQGIVRIGESAFKECQMLTQVMNFSSLDLVCGSTDHGFVARYCTTLYNADSFGQEGDFLYYTKSGIRYIYDYVGHATEITIPAGYELADAAFRDKSELVSVTLPAGIKRIAPHLFHGCTSLTSVLLPEGITEIGDFAFCYCRGLEQIDLPASLRRIGAGAFSRCQYLSSLEIPNGVNEIGQMAFKRCERLTAITLPTSITAIAPYTFMGCYYLDTVVVPEGVTSIGNFAFYACLNFRHLSLPSTLLSIGRYAFYYNKLQELSLPSGLTHLGEGAFKTSQGFTSVTIPEGVTEVPDYAFCNTYVRDVALPNSLTRIGRSAFSRCPVQNINWPSHLTTIGYQAFAYSDELRTPAIPSMVTQVGDMLFYHSKTTQEDDMPAVYCYANAVVPTSTFHGSDMSHSVLYVRPELVAAYRASEHAALFADICPVGDYNGDGQVTAADLVSIIHVNATLSDYSKRHLPLGARDVNGDGTVTNDDVIEARRALLGQTIVPAHITQMPSTPQPEPYLPTLSDNCVLMTFDGTFQTEDDASLELINHIRWEACNEGVKDPEISGRRLVPADYVEAQWSTDLEHIARRRAVHTVISQYHSDMGDANNDKWNDVNGGLENIGFYDMLFSVYAYYDEKDGWIYPNNRTTGHYTTLINQSICYYGLAYVQGYGVSLLSSARKIPEGADQSYLDDGLVEPMVLDVYKKYIQDHAICTTDNSLYRYTAPTLELGQTQQLELRAHLVFDNGISTQVQRYVRYFGRAITFLSQNPDIATITPDGLVTPLRKGDVTLEAQLDGETVATITITVTCHHQYETSEADADHKATGTCQRCGETIEGSVPTNFYLMWTNYTLNPSWHSGGVPSVNPVGTKIGCHMYQCDGDEAFRDICVEYLDPTLLTGPTEFHLSSEEVFFNVIGTGRARLRMYLKHNPKISRTYTITLSDPVNAASAPNRMAQLRSGAEFEIPTFPLPELSSPEK